MSKGKYDGLSCLDAAYERKAIDEGVNKTPVFLENIEYLKKLQLKREKNETSKRK